MRWSGASAHARYRRAAVIGGITLVALFGAVFAWSLSDRSESRPSEVALSSSYDPPPPEWSLTEPQAAATQTVVTTATVGPSTPERSAGKSVINKDIWTLTDSRTLDEGTSTKVPGGRLRSGVVISATARKRGLRQSHVFMARMSIFEPTAPSPKRPYSMQGSWRIDPKGTAASVRYTATSVKGTLFGQFKESPLEMNDVRLGVLVMGRRALGSRAAGRGVYDGSSEFKGTLTVPRVSVPDGN